MLISVCTHWISLQQGNDSLVLTDAQTKGSAALITEDLGDLLITGKTWVL